MRLFIATFDFNEGSRDSILHFAKSHLNPKTFIAVHDFVTMLLLQYSAFYDKRYICDMSDDCYEVRVEALFLITEDQCQSQ